MAEVQQEIKLTEEQEKEGYGIEREGDRVLVWHKKNQIALLYSSPDIGKKVQDVVKKRRRELQEVYEKTGWKQE
ncbi:MAG: hypothetical protein COT13_00435 [Chloroflexi bacterium CG08_land_8_20_14_0_20_45_12]|nr:MAG: hypothetical protein AUK00_01340 [Dehalococcoidia bacterium CG2_30_46_9]PIU23927.1 MAG: hypothetical protein COT13_00435 [Chloroflexi bacterium CG08_land_8_20_14_0_20_45_12]PIX27389.1 MAG: hypothetical protein COZ67_02525 [Chloroflexi bacterium CG_4_8_14_3_um_filter_45_15]